MINRDDCGRKGRDMNNRAKKAPSGVEAETILQPAAYAAERAAPAKHAAPAEHAKVCCPRREIVAGSGPHLTKETQTLLRLRLRAAALILLVGFGVFLVRHVVGVLTGEPLSPVLLGFHVLIVLVLAFSAMPLCRRCTVSIKKLRIN